VGLVSLQAEGAHTLAKNKVSIVSGLDGQTEVGWYVWAWYARRGAGPKGKRDSLPKLPRQTGV
jgi:hypothetical protein